MKHTSMANRDGICRRVWGTICLLPYTKQLCCMQVLQLDSFKLNGLTAACSGAFWGALAQLSRLRDVSIEFFKGGQRTYFFFDSLSAMTQMR